MASVTSEWEIQEETKCPICKDYFIDPVNVECGHNFCQVCLTRYCEKWTKGDNDSLFCPVCKAHIWKRSPQSNWDLANITEKNKKWSLKTGKENVCERHEKSLDHFCEEDGEAMCVVCLTSPEHSSHMVLLIEEAVQKYKKQIWTHLQTLKKDRGKLLGFNLTEERKIKEYLEKTDAERWKIVSEFKHLHQFLEEQEQFLLARLGEFDKEIVKVQNENVTKISEEISHLSGLIRELEKKCHQPMSEFLQGVRSTIGRCEKEKFQQLEDMSPELEIRLDYWCQQSSALKETLRKIKDFLPRELEKEWGTSLAESVTKTHRKANVTLDPNTAHPQLVLSEDQKCVRRGATWQDVPDNPERFASRACVLGCQGFTSGRHYWDMEVMDGERWAVGVARESVQRKEWIRHFPEKGIWAVECDRDQYQAHTSPLTFLPLSWVPRRIRVSLDYEGGNVAFFDADRKAPIFSFPAAIFNGERLCPWLWVWGKGSQLRLCP